MAAYKGPLDYIDVATRLREMREKYPELTMVQRDLKFLDFAGKSWVVFTAAAYRIPDDPRPGIGTAWEPVPGPTQFTRDSEVQNAETAAWGRALVAIGADTRSGIASQEEVRNRQTEAAPQLSPAHQQLRALLAKSHPDSADRKFYLEAKTGRDLAGLADMTEDEVASVIADLTEGERK